MAITFSHDGLVVDGELVPLWSGSFHYWRHDRKLWPAILDNIGALGFKMICTYIPWDVHEVEKGKFDFGESDGRKDIGAFLDLLKERGFYALARPGPHINSEMSYFGYPRRVLLDPEVQAHDANGSVPLGGWGIKHFPMPSYASEKFYEEVGTYFDALMPILRERLHPKGSIVAIQSDNENCFFFLLGAYALDYSPGSICLYRKTLEQRYGDIAALNDMYGTSFLSFEEIDPPREFRGSGPQDLRYHLDWVEYKEYHIRYGLNRVAKMFRGRGIEGIPVFHNACASQMSPYDVVATECSQARLSPQSHLPDEEDSEIDILGYDIYAGREGYSQMRQLAKFLHGDSVLPFIPELGSGIWTHRGSVYTPEEEEFILLAGLMHGIRGVNFYMIVDRDRWVGAPITRDNRRRAGYFEFYEKFSKFLSESDFWSYEKESDIVLLYSYDLARFDRAFSRMDYVLRGPLTFPRHLHIPEEKLGFTYDPDKAQPHKWIRRADEILGRASLGFDYADTNLPLKRLSKYQVACVQTADFMAREVQEELLDFARQGGRLVLGPILPRLDMNMKPCGLIADELKGKTATTCGEGTIALLTESAISPSSLVGDEFPATEFAVEGERIEIAVHRSAKQCLLFAANAGEEPAEAKIKFSGRRKFHGLWRAEDTEANEALGVSLEPYSISVWEVQQNA